MFDKKVLNIFSVFIGVFFLLSGFGKVIDTAGFSALISLYGLKYFMILSPLIVIAEILLGLLLILLIETKRTSFVSCLLLILFTASFAYAHFVNGIDDCGCFGTMQKSTLPPLYSFIRNLLLILFSFVIWIKYPREKSHIAKWKKYILILVMSVTVFTAGFTFTTPFPFKKQPPKHKFQDQPIRKTDLAKYLTTSADSTYLVFCFSYSCSHCWNSIENLRQYESSGAADRVVILASGKPSDKRFFMQNFKPGLNLKDLPADTLSKLINVFPTAFYIEHDSVKVIIETVLPSPVTFKKNYISPAKQ